MSSHVPRRRRYYSRRGYNCEENGTAGEGDRYGHEKVSELVIAKIRLGYNCQGEGIITRKMGWQVKGAGMATNNFQNMKVGLEGRGVGRDL